MEREPAGKRTQVPERVSIEADGPSSVIGRSESEAEERVSIETAEPSWSAEASEGKARERLSIRVDEPSGAVAGLESEAQASETKGKTVEAMKGEKRMETGDFGNKAWTEGAKKAIELYVENSERMARMMLELHERSTTWAKETMLAPLFEAQRTAGKQMVESSVEMARKLYGIDKSNGN
jgi:hypothetical protein